MSLESLIILHYTLFNSWLCQLLFGHCVYKKVLLPQIQYMDFTLYLRVSAQRLPLPNPFWVVVYITACITNLSHIWKCGVTRFIICQPGVTPVNSCCTCENCMHIISILASCYTCLLLKNCLQKMQHFYFILVKIMAILNTYIQ